MKRATMGLLAILLIGTAAACIQGSNVEQVKAGMTPEQVAAIMGPADGTTNEPGRRCDFYTVLKDFWSRVPWSMSDRYYVCYTDGKVDTFGRADGKPDQPLPTAAKS
jgi:hypothetical protein